VSIVVNLLNPAVVVLGGYFAAFPEWLVEPVRNEVAARVLAPGAGGSRVLASQLGFTAATSGGRWRRCAGCWTTRRGSPDGATERGGQTMTELLAMTGIVKSFPGVRALDGVDLDVRAGEVHCLLGQNGAASRR